MTSSSYRYSPLATNTSIRILSLQASANFDAPLRCNITQYDRYDVDSMVKDSVIYEACSYAWGQPDFTEPLHCGSNNFIKITKTVESMLRHLRKPTKQRNLWIDAICINQEDQAERSHQVQGMKSIFAHAEKVQVWLGVGEGDDGEAFALIRALSSIRPDVSDVRGVARGNPDVVAEVKASKVEARNLLPEARHREPLRKLLLLPWFVRRWVLQEVFVGQTCMVRYGKHKVPLQFLIRGLSSLTKQTTQSFSNSNNAQVAQALGTVQSLRKPGRHLLDLLWNFSHTRCSDPRDRVFALLGFLSAEAGNAALDFLKLVDYTKPWRQVYAEVTRLCLQQGYFELVLQHAHVFGVVKSTEPGYPSYIPDWSGPSRLQDVLPLLKEDADFYPSDRLRSSRKHGLMRPGFTTVLFVSQVTFRTIAKWPLRSVYANLAADLSAFFSPLSDPLSGERCSPVSADSIGRGALLLCYAMLMGIPAKLDSSETIRNHFGRAAIDDIWTSLLPRSQLQDTLKYWTHSLASYLRGRQLGDDIDEPLGADLAQAASSMLISMRLFHLSTDVASPSSTDVTIVGPRSIEEGDWVIRIHHIVKTIWEDPDVELTNSSATFGTRFFALWLCLAVRPDPLWVEQDNKISRIKCSFVSFCVGLGDVPYLEDREIELV